MYFSNIIQGLSSNKNEHLLNFPIVEPNFDKTKYTYSRNRKFHHILLISFTIFEYVKINLFQRLSPNWYLVLIGWDINEESWMSNKTETKGFKI